MARLVMRLMLAWERRADRAYDREAAREQAARAERFSKGMQTIWD